MRNDQTIIDGVKEDIVAGLTPYLSAVKFHRLPLFEDSPDAITDGDTSVVIWQCSGVNDKNIHNVQAAGQLVTVEGVTIVQRNDAEPPDTWRFHRFIDWNSFAAQLGTSRGRADQATKFEGRLLPAGLVPGGVGPAS
jgi:hypothetical protein